MPTQTPKSPMEAALEVLREFTEDIKVSAGTGRGDQIDAQLLDWPDLAVTYHKAVKALRGIAKAKRDKLAITIKTATGAPDPYAHLTAKQIGELREAAIRTIMHDLDGAADDQSSHWAECYLDSNPRTAQTYLGVLDWDNLETEERARIGLSFDPATGKRTKNGKGH